jgi:creatinine amidohydrolase/Fe(II)-dependent formamide hydrolase-like protein
MGALTDLADLLDQIGQAADYTAADDGWLELLFADGVLALSDNGVLGDPTRASAAAGEAIMDALTDEIHGWMSRELSLESTDGAAPVQP